MGPHCRIVRFCAHARPKNQKPATMKPFTLEKLNRFALVLGAALLAAPATLSLAAEGAPQPAAAAPAAAKPDLNAGSNKFGAVCAACHGADGNSAIPANPKLAQQHPEYLVKQLQEFKAGKRPGVGPGTVMPAKIGRASCRERV